MPFFYRFIFDVERHTMLNITTDIQDSNEINFLKRAQSIDPGIHGFVFLLIMFLNDTVHLLSQTIQEIVSIIETCILTQYVMDMSHDCDFSCLFNES
jgi:hypothetical protein